MGLSGGGCIWVADRRIISSNMIWWVEERPDKDGPADIINSNDHNKPVSPVPIFMFDKTAGADRGREGEEVDQLLSIENTGRKRWITIL